jgi:xanthine dehydrogenase accessory factor
VDAIYQELAGLLERKERLAFAVLVETKGSTPQKCGAKAIFLPDGRVIGTLGGGCLEAETRQKALRAIETGESFTFKAVLDDDFGWDDGLICGGSVQTFVQPNPQTGKVWDALLKNPASRERRVLATIVTGEQAGMRALLVGDERLAGTASPTNDPMGCGGSKKLPEQVAPQETISAGIIEADPISSDVLDQIRHRSAAMLSEPEPEPSSFILLSAEALPAAAGLAKADHPSSLSVYLEPILPKPVLVICGGGHVGCAVGKLAAWSGFDVVAIDDRASFANKERFPDASKIIVDDPAKVMKDFPLDADSYVCVVTRGHRHDAVILKEIIHSKAGYIGMIGSKRKVRTVMEGFIKEGIATAEQFRRVRTPMGLAIHSLTVEEIAVSVVSELIAVRRGARNFVSLSVTNALADKMLGQPADRAE